MSDDRTPIQEDNVAQLADERTRIERLGRIRELVFGSLDGLLVPLGVISGVAGGTGDTRAVIVAGVAEAFAGALSMGAGEFISGRAEAQVQQREIDRELDKMRLIPGYELWEMEQMMRNDGISVEDSRLLASVLARYPKAYANVMVSRELGLQIEPQAVHISEALTMAASYIVGSIFPLAAYFFLPVPRAIPVSLALTFVALLAIGTIKGKLASIHIGRSILEIVLVAAVSAGGGYLLGNAIPRWLGFG
ncbi:MAG TPA: VIT1/CCC1 transporter family protein [Chloroflexota bacterium]|nr:VIT1/CCC1 transporter family protein [Chloroflexota bacterium]